MRNEDENHEAERPLTPLGRGGVPEEGTATS